MRRGLGAGWRSRGWARERRITDGGTYCTPNFPSTSLPGSEAYLMGSLLSCWVLLETCTLVLRWWQEAAVAGRAQWERGNAMTRAIVSLAIHPPPPASKSPSLIVLQSLMGNQVWRSRKPACQWMNTLQRKPEGSALSQLDSATEQLVPAQSARSAFCVLSTYSYVNLLQSVYHDSYKYFLLHYSASCLKKIRFTSVLLSLSLSYPFFRRY